MGKNTGPEPTESHSDGESVGGGLRSVVTQTLVTLTTVKWVVLSLIAGVLVGVPTAAFLLILDAGIFAVGSLPYFYLLIPVGLVTSYFIVSRLAPDAKGHGTEQVIEAIHRRDGDIKLRVVPVKMAATLITLILGGSAGKEGPSAQIGAGVASGFARMIHMNKLDKQRFVLCGISAGFSGVFGTPIAGAIFASEVLSIGRFHYNRLLPSLIASYVSVLVTRTLGVRHLSFTVDFSGAPDLVLIFQMVVFGLVMGLLAVLFIWMLNRTEHVFERLAVPGSVKALFGGALLIAVVLVTGTTNYVGLGMGLVDSALDGEPYRGIAPIFKMLTTSITLSSGGSGGILTPIFFIGATMGNIWAQFFDLNIAVYSAIGMVAFLAATTNTPIAAAFMAIELFGLQTGSWAVLASAVSFLIVGHVSVFPSQIIFQKKTFFADMEVHDIPLNFSWNGIRRIFLSFFRGYRLDRDVGIDPGGSTVAEHAGARTRLVAEAVAPRISYYPLSAWPETPNLGPAAGDPSGNPRMENEVLDSPETADRIRECVDNASRICVLTGAGISAECGIPTFRDSPSGYWNRFNPTELATVAAFNEHPARTWSWYAARRLAVRSVDPGPGHLALARLEAFAERVTVVTQNVDGLHGRAGSSRVLDIHGNILRVRCPNGCVNYHREDDDPQAQRAFAGDMVAAVAANTAEEEVDFSDVDVPRCPTCGSFLRPDVVWFGEMLPASLIDAAFVEAERCDLLLTIGTSGLVQPAASLPIVALDHGTTVIEINPAATPISRLVTLSVRAGAGAVLSRVV